MKSVLRLLQKFSFYFWILAERIFWELMELIEFEMVFQIRLNILVCFHVHSDWNWFENRPLLNRILLFMPV